MKVYNPATQEVIKDLIEDTAADVTAKFKKAQAAFSLWNQLKLEDRIQIITKFHDLLEKNIEELARTLSLEVGKPIVEARNEINGARTRIRFFVENSAQWLTQKELNNDGKTRDVLGFDPLGVICNISAWNYPYLVGVNVFVPALIGGNSVLYKPSEFSTLTGLHIASLLHEAGVPQDVFITVIGGASTGEALLQQDCHGYFFTGSYKTGKYIAEKVAHKLVPVGLELGGKDPLYVTEDQSDLAQTAAAVVEGCFYNNGQSCCAVERVYVHKKVYDQFMDLFVTEVKKLKMGDPTDPSTTQGAITRSPHIAFLESQVRDAQTKGAKLIVGGKPSTHTGFYPPTVLTDVNHSMILMKDETFGPVIGVMPVQSDEEAINLMNDTEYGLTAAVYCQDEERAKKILTQVNSGTAYINCCDRVSPYLPWAGRKNSGLGATLSYLGILSFVKPKGWHVRRQS